MRRDSHAPLRRRPLPAAVLGALFLAACATGGGPAPDDGAGVGIRQAPGETNGHAEAAAVITPPEPMPPAEPSFRWPVSGPVTERAGTSGIGIRASGSVLAVKSGVVSRSLSSWHGIRNLLILRHADGFYSMYGDADEVLSPMGKAVRQGEPIARFHAAGGTLRFRLYRGEQAVDPMAYLR